MSLACICIKVRACVCEREINKMGFQLCKQLHGTSRRKQKPQGTFKFIRCKGSDHEYICAV